MYNTKTLFTRYSTNSHMIIPVRCFTCNKVLGSLYQKYKQMKNESDSSDDVIDQDEIIDESGTLTPAIQKILTSSKNLRLNGTAANVT